MNRTLHFAIHPRFNSDSCAITDSYSYSHDRDKGFAREVALLMANSQNRDRGLA